MKILMRENNKNEVSNMQIPVATIMVDFHETIKARRVYKDTVGEFFMEKGNKIYIDSDLKAPKTIKLYEHNYINVKCGKLGADKLDHDNVMGVYSVGDNPPMRIEVKSVGRVFRYQYLDTISQHNNAFTVEDLMGFSYIGKDSDGEMLFTDGTFMEVKNDGN